MALTVAIIAQGEMGAGIGQRLAERGATVLTSLAGRSAASAQRAAAATMVAVTDDARLVAEADFFLSVVPPRDAVALAKRMAPALAASPKKPAYLECNAISPARTREVAATIAATGSAFIDGGIVGPPPSPGKPGGRIYISGPEAKRAMALAEYGLDMRLLDGEIGAASALKNCYAALTKGTQALGVALMLAAMRSGVAAALRQEFAASQPALYGYLQRQIPGMYHKAYRWIAEMAEIGDNLGEACPGAREAYRGTARIYEQLGPAEIALLDKFLER